MADAVLNNRQMLQDSLLAWYRRHRRAMPWRAGEGQAANPYHVWLSEIMLQQTTVAAAAPYFLKFVEKWPDVFALAGATQDEVLAAWSGLGYYARARNLHKCARVVAGELDGAFPDTVEGLQALPGIGPYTAAAVASIAFGRQAVAVDGNVERVVARLFAVTEPMPKSKPRLKALAGELGADNPDPADFTQAFMELGATLCTPKSPKCALCPWRTRCAAHKQGIAEDIPRRERARKPERFGTAYWIQRRDGAFLMRKRPEKGLLGGMYEVPSTDWSRKSGFLTYQDAPERVIAESPLPGADWTLLDGRVFHVFTHFRLELSVLSCRLDDPLEAALTLANDDVWVDRSEIGDFGVPSVMQKIINFADKTV